MKKFDIDQFHPCSNALEWYNQQPSTKAAWANCHRSDWLLWIAIKMGVDNRLLTLTAAYCAKTVYHLMTDERSRDGVVTAINYGRGKIDRDELKDAADAAYAATDAATDATYDAAYAAANATAAAYAARAAYAVVRAAAYAAANATDAYAADAERKNQQQTADICRKYLTDAVFNKLKQLS